MTRFYCFLYRKCVLCYIWFHKIQQNQQHLLPNSKSERLSITCRGFSFDLQLNSICVWSLSLRPLGENARLELKCRQHTDMHINTHTHNSNKSDQMFVQDMSGKSSLFLYTHTHILQKILVNQSHYYVCAGLGYL